MLIVTCFLPLLGVVCPEGTKPCKDNNTICATYCNGNPECTDGSDEIDCGKYTMNDHDQQIDFWTSINPSPSATNASATFLPSATDAPTTSLPSGANAIAQSAETSGIEIERADVPQGTTDITEVSLQQITIIGRETVAAGVMSIVNGASKCTFF
jgi:hypothetical protein